MSLLHMLLVVFSNGTCSTVRRQDLNIIEHWAACLLRRLCTAAAQTHRRPHGGSSGVVSLATLHVACKRHMGTVMFSHLAQHAAQHDQLRLAANSMAGLQSELSQLAQDIRSSVQASVHAGRLITTKSSTLLLQISGTATSSPSVLQLQGASTSSCTMPDPEWLQLPNRLRLSPAFPKGQAPPKVKTGNSGYQQAC